MHNNNSNNNNYNNYNNNNNNRVFGSLFGLNRIKLGILDFYEEEVCN